MSTPLVEPDWHTAHRVAFEAAAPLPAEPVSLPDAVGCVTATDVTSLAALPGHDSSAMDGWAVAGPAPWRRVGRVLAGDLAPAPLEPGTCVEIATGAIVPPGTQGILRSEHGEQAGDEVTRTDAARPDEPAPGEHVRPAGAEAQLGDVLIERGTLLSPVHVGLAAAAGLDAIEVHRRPVVDVCVLGDELLTGGVPMPGQVRDALGPQLPGVIRAFGADPGPVTRVPDTLEATLAAIGGCTGEMIWTTGGTAHGPVDHMHRALDALGADVVVDSVAMRPGHPLLLARLPRNSAERWLVALPGNPLSAIVGALTAAWPLLHRLRGLPAPQLGSGRAAEPLRTNGRDTRLVPVTRHDDGLRARPWLVSAMLRGLAGADAIAVVPPAGVPAGGRVEVLPLPW